MYYYQLISTPAYPSLRRSYHNSFESIHRFAGWSVLLTFWVNTIIVALDIHQVSSATTWHSLIKSPSFWFLSGTTVSIISPWFRLHHISVEPDQLSEHAIRLHFNYFRMPFCAILRFSTSPFLEWHSFATIPDANHTTASVVISGAGDWTNTQIAKLPTKIWIRGPPVRNFLYTSRLFRSIVLVATGSGIGPCLSLIAAKLTPIRILWSTRDPIQTYGQEIVDMVRAADKHAVIWNTTGRERPSLPKEALRLYNESEAEAVCVVSNRTGTNEVVRSLASRGIPVYGAIFDS